MKHSIIQTSCQKDMINTDNTTMYNLHGPTSKILQNVQEQKNAKKGGSMHITHLLSAVNT